MASFPLDDIILPQTKECIDEGHLFWLKGWDNPGALGNKLRWLRPSPWATVTCFGHSASLPSPYPMESNSDGLGLTSGSDMTKSCSWARFAASMTFSLGISLVLSPYLILSIMLQANNTGSWETIPMFERRNWTFTFLLSRPSIICQ